MRSTLYLKFIAIYIAFGFLSIFCVGTLTSHLLLNRIEDNASSAIYREASLFSNDYLPSFFSGDLPLSSVKKQLTGMQDYMGASVWFVKRDGSLIAASAVKGHPNAPATIFDFDPTENGLKVRMRIDGILRTYYDIPNDIKQNIITRIKILSGMNITETRLPQDGAIKTTLENMELERRVSALPTKKGEKIVIRILDFSRSVKGLEYLYFNEKNYKKILQMIDSPNGIILVTGATGSGKSTTVYSFLQRLNQKEVNLITVEDPVEMELEGISCLEAIACGKLTIVSNSPLSATKTFAIDDKCIFKNRKPQSLANVIDYWIEHPEEKKKYESDEALVKNIAKNFQLLMYIRYDEKDDNIPKNYEYKDEKHKYIATAVEALLAAFYLDNYKKIKYYII